MKNLVRKIYISQHDFIIPPSMYVGLKYIEVDLSKTIDSMEAIDAVGTNLLTMFPVVADEYYYFFYIRLFQNLDTATRNFTLTTLDGGDLSYVTPTLAYKDTLAAYIYAKTSDFKDTMAKGFSVSSTFTDVHCVGIKINTS